MGFSSEIHEALSTAYRVVALLFLPPHRSARRLNEELAEKLRTMGEALLYSPCPSVGEAAVELAMRLSSCLSDTGCWNEFNGEATSIYIAGPGGAPCPPYESVYRIPGKRKIIAVPSISESLKRYYKALGLEAVEGKGITVDHASVELEFLAALHEVEASLLAGGYPASVLEEVRSLRRKFLSEHILAWIPDFVSCLRERVRHPLLKALTGLLGFLVNCDSHISV